MKQTYLATLLTFLNEASLTPSFIHLSNLTVPYLGLTRRQRSHMNFRSACYRFPGKI